MGWSLLDVVENYVISVSRFQLETSGFFGNGQALVSGTVLSIEESFAYLDRVAFISIVNKPQTVHQDVPYDLHNCTELAQIISTTDRVIVILLRRTNISITHNLFKGNNVGLIGAVIYYNNDFVSDNIISITIVNTTFFNNSASDLIYAEYAYYCYNIISSIVYANSSGSSVQVYDSKFIQNVGVIVIGVHCNMLITHTKFLPNVIFLVAIGVLT